MILNVSGGLPRRPMPARTPRSRPRRLPRTPRPGPRPRRGPAGAPQRRRSRPQPRAHRRRQALLWGVLELGQLSRHRLRDERRPLAVYVRQGLRPPVLRVKLPHLVGVRYLPLKYNLHLVLINVRFTLGVAPVHVILETRGPLVGRVVRRRLEQIKLNHQLTEYFK